ncbi:GNAT family N-acetyltransferase [Streptomyces sp. SID5770]|uniref:GNAT family N-acetyltransferase n=1 Tax=unclassified Streptomyces TaxID=2593676 RepID=UPI000EF83841|nr:MULTISPECIES: GNAT family N-acetyltransferase [unclassified Streptomyces]MZE56801.1 GNAT family N-acetyltransferase [Streptomyces sp. SID5770]
MSTALPCPELPPAPAAVVRTAGSDDVEAVRRLSRPFVREGSLRDRTAAELALAATDFLVVEAGREDLAGCVGLRARTDARGGPAAVLYNFCVAPGHQGRGIGSALLDAALGEAAARGAARVFTATTGSGLLFLRYGFTPGGDEEAPPVWRASLDPARGSRILVRALG